jgi:hypothetical protein
LGKDRKSFSQKINESTFDNKIEKQHDVAFQLENVSRNAEDEFKFHVQKNVIQMQEYDQSRIYLNNKFYLSILINV